MAAYIFYGKAGSGKGTQALKLKEFLESQGKSVIYIETGSMIRQYMASNETFTQKRTNDIMNAGELMPPFFPIWMWSDALIKTYTGAEDIIFDGVGRRLEEGHIFDSALNFFQVSKRHVFHIHITDQTAIERLQIRGQGRADDTDVSKIQNRLDWYRKNVIPTIEYFQSNPDYHCSEINGEESVDGVWGQIKEVLS